MNTKSAMKSRMAAIAVAGVATLGYCATGYAGCADAKWSDAPGALNPGGAVSQLMNSAPGAFVRITDRPTIVGLWKFEMISKSTPTHQNPMPDGTLIDFGTAAWHADGTEFQTSGIRNPGDGDVCQGVWQQVDHETFVLNHYALAWTNGTYTGPVNIRARVTLDPTGNHYSGMFATVVYLATPVAGHEFDQSTILASITGTFTATRVTLR